MGQRKNEVYQLRWGDLHLIDERPVAHFRAETMKDKKERWVPLPRRLAKGLRHLWRPEFSPARRVFWHLFPVDETFHADLKKAGISRINEVGEVVHFHSFRKTHASLGAEHGVSQKATQDNLGHSDANLTANIYARISAEARRNELAKLPWIDAHGHAHDSGGEGHMVSFPDKTDSDIQLPKAAGAEELRPLLSLPVKPPKWWTLLDSNQRPFPCQGNALTN
jgi:integrase